ncbi:putative ribonuclease H-like domain-containing protein, partial [Tanacetum coccineum]
DLEQVDEFDLEEMDLKCQVALISIRLRKFYKKTRRKLQFNAKEPIRFDKTKEEPKALVTLDGDGVDWTGHAEDEQENFTLMAYSNSGSDTEVEAQLVYHQKNQLVYEEKIRFMKIDLEDKTNVLIYHKKLLAEAVKEKEELKTKLENFQSSSKGLSKLLNSQMSANDKSGLGFAKVKGMHVVPPPMTGIYMPPKSDFGIDESKFTYGPKQFKTSESDAKTSDFAFCESNSSVETLESYESDSDDEYVIKPSKEQEKPSFAFVNTVKHVKTPRETVKEQNTCSPSPKSDKRDWNGLMSKKLGLGYGFTRKACFVCGSFGHLIRDCDFHEKRMAKQVELNKQKGKGTGQGENRPVWNNVQRLNHQNNQAAATSITRKVNTARPIVNEIRLRNNLYKSHSSIRRPFNRTTTPKANFTNHKVNTAGDKIVSAVGGNREAAVKASTGCNWRSKRHYWNKVSKYNSRSNSSKNDDLQKALKNKGIVDSGCSRHMTGNKAYLVEYHDYNGGPIAFGGSKGQITSKGPKEANHSAVKSSKAKNGGEKPNGDTAEAFRKEFAQCTEYLLLQAGAARATSTNIVNTISTPVSTASPSRVFSAGGPSYPDLTNNDQDDSQIPSLIDIYDNPSNGIFTNASYDDEGAVADFTNLETTVNVSPIPTSRIHSIHPTTQILGDPTSAVQTRSKVNKSSRAHAFKISQALEGESWVDVMQEELLQFKIQKVWILGYRQEEGIVYDEVFAPVAKIEAIRIFLAFASYMGFIVYQMDVKSAFLYGTIDEEVYVSQPLGFVDPKFPKKVYKVVKALYGLHQAPRACQDKYVPEILKKSVKTASTPIETQKPLIKDEEAANVDIHLYRSMIGSLMYLTTSRPDIMFAVYACSRFQVTPKTSHLHAMKRIFRYLKGKPKLGLWYPRVSSFDLEAYSDSDYARANLDRKSTIGGCQFLGRRLILWQCRKQTIVATSTTEAEYVAAANCYGQVL